MAASTRSSGSRPIGQVQSLDAHFGSAWRRARLTAEERIARGKDARNQTPRSTHAHWAPAAAAQIRSRCSRSSRQIGWQS